MVGARFSEQSLSEVAKEVCVISLWKKPSLRMISWVLLSSTGGQINLRTMSGNDLVIFMIATWQEHKAQDHIVPESCSSFQLYLCTQFSFPHPWDENRNSPQTVGKSCEIPCLHVLWSTKQIACLLLEAVVPSPSWCVSGPDTTQQDWAQAACVHHSPPEGISP